MLSPRVIWGQVRTGLARWTPRPGRLGARHAGRRGKEEMQALVRGPNSGQGTHKSREPGVVAAFLHGKGLETRMASP